MKRILLRWKFSRDLLGVRARLFSFFFLFFHGVYFSFCLFLAELLPRVNCKILGNFNHYSNEESNEYVSLLEKKKKKEKKEKELQVQQLSTEISLKKSFYLERSSFEREGKRWIFFSNCIILIMEKFVYEMLNLNCRDYRISYA